MKQYVHIPNARGTLEAPLRRHSAVMYVNSELYNLIKSKLEWQDWTFLLVDNECGVTELVKVIGCVASNGLTIERGKEYSIAGEFTTAILRYVDTLDAIISRADKHKLTISTTGGIGLFNENTLEYPVIKFTHLGNTESVGDSKIILSVKSLATCCKTGQPPEIPLELLPYRIIDNNELRILDDTEIRSISG